ncbi:MAG: imidazoleglycerol-phosphate dehydratase HisB [Spirochaetaceae bacterium]
MDSRKAEVRRETAETQVQASVTLDTREDITIHTGLPFFDHMLHAMSFHGGFRLDVSAEGDIQVDPHHLTEDVGLVLGDCFSELLSRSEQLARFGHAVVPMDDALSEAVVDAGGRPYLVYRAEYPQAYAGSFQLALFGEFFRGFATRSRCNVHLWCRYGDNSHHMVEALFKAFGRALGEAFSLQSNASAMSTKGII